MRFFSLATIAVCIFVSQVEAQTVVQNSNVQFGSSIPGNFHGSNYEFLLCQDAAAIDYTGAFFKYANPTIQLVDLLLDEGTDWYVVRPGDVFGPSQIQAGAFAKVFEVRLPWVFPQPAADVGSSDFWLGVATSRGGAFKSRTAFGWVHMRPTIPFPGFNELVMVENVMSYDSGGIIVGTTTTVPEPGVVTLILIGLSAFCAFCRRR